MLRCADGTLYTGIANDVSRRRQQHNAGTGSRYTRSRLPVKLVYQEAHASRGSALRREAAIKASGVIDRMAKINKACRDAGIAIFYGQADHRQDGRDFAPQIVDLGHQDVELT